MSWEVNTVSVKCLDYSFDVGSVKFNYSEVLSIFQCKYLIMNSADNSNPQ